MRKWDFFTFFGLEKWECTMFLGEYRAKLDSKGRPSVGKMILRCGGAMYLSVGRLGSIW